MGQGGVGGSERVEAASLLHAPRTLRWVRAELTPPGPGEVWLQTLAGAVSVGTEGPLSTGATPARLKRAPTRS